MSSISEPRTPTSPAPTYSSTVRPLHTRISTPPPAHLTPASKKSLSRRDSDAVSIASSADSAHNLDDSTRQLIGRGQVDPIALGFPKLARKKASGGTRKASIEAFARGVLQKVWNGTDKVVGTVVKNEKVRPWVVAGTVAVIAGTAIGVTHGAAAAAFGALLLGAAAGSVAKFHKQAWGGTKWLAKRACTTNGAVCIIGAPVVIPLALVGLACGAFSAAGPGGPSYSTSGGGGGESRWNNAGMHGFSSDGGHNRPTANTNFGGGDYQSWRHA